MSIRAGQAKGPWVGPNLSTPTPDDHKVLVEAADALAEYLKDKITATGGITATTYDKGGGIEAIDINGSGVAGDHKVLASLTDNTAETLIQKITTSGNITATTIDKGGGNLAVQLSVPADQDIKVKATAADTTTDYLDSKVAVTGGLSKSTLNPGGNEQIQISGAGVAGDHKVLASLTDNTAETLIQKITTSGNITATTIDKGGGNLAVQLSVPADQDIKVKATAADTTTDYLNSKVAVTGGLSKSTLNPGGNEQIQISGAGVAGDHKVLNSGADTTANYLTSKIVAGTGVSLVTLNAGGNEQTQINVSTGGTTPQAIYAEVYGVSISHGPTVNNNFAPLAGTYTVGSTRVDTASATNGVITLPVAGVRSIDCALCFTGTPNTTWEFALAISGTPLTDGTMDARLGNVNDHQDVSLTAIHDFTAGQTLQLYVRQVGATGGSITVERVNLNEHADLGDGTVRVSSDDTTAGYLEDKISLEGLQGFTKNSGSNETLDIGAIPGFEDRFYESKPFWAGTQAITSGDFSLPGGRLLGIAENNIADWIRTGIEGDFDYKIGYNLNGAAQGGFRIEGNGIVIDFKNVAASGQLQRTVTGIVYPTVTVPYPGTSGMLRITRVTRVLRFFYKTGGYFDPWIELVSAGMTADIGFDVKLSLLSMTNGDIPFIYLWDNSFPKRVRSAYGKQIPLTDGATITPDLRQGNLQTVTLGGNRTIANPTENQVNNGFMWVLRLRQDGTGSRTVSWGAKYRFPGGTTPTLTTTINKSDYFGFCYNSTDDKWDCIAQEFNL